MMKKSWRPYWKMAVVKEYQLFFYNQKINFILQSPKIKKGTHFYCISCSFRLTSSRLAIWNTLYTPEYDTRKTQKTIWLDRNSLEVCPIIDWSNRIFFIIRQGRLQANMRWRMNEMSVILMARCSLGVTFSGRLLPRRGM